MRYAFRLLALVATTVFGVISVFLVVVLVRFRIQSYEIFHQFPKYGFNRDFRLLVPAVLASMCSGTLYYLLVRSARNSK